MNILNTAPPYTPEDLERMPDRDFYELVDGNLVERHMGGEASWASRRCATSLGRFCDDNHLGWVFDGDASYQCFPKPRTVRKPDVSFIRLGRLPDETPPQGNIRIPPDLAIEVVSPNDLAYEVDQKLLEYLEVSIPLVWVINPDSRIVHVYRADGACRLLWEGHELSGEDMVPGFRCLVRELFQPPTPTAAPAPGE